MPPTKAPHNLAILDSNRALWAFVTRLISLKPELAAEFSSLLDSDRALWASATRLISLKPELAAEFSSPLDSDRALWAFAMRLISLKPELAAEFSSPLPLRAIARASDALGPVQFDPCRLADGLCEIRNRYLIGKRFNLREHDVGTGPSLTKLSKDLAAIHRGLLAAAAKIVALNLPTSDADANQMRILAKHYQDLADGIATRAKSYPTVLPSDEALLTRRALELFGELGGKSRKGSYVRFVRAAAMGAGIKEPTLIPANTIQSEKKRLGLKF